MDGKEGMLEGEERGKAEQVEKVSEGEGGGGASGQQVMEQKKTDEDKQLRAEICYKTQI